MLNLLPLEIYFIVTLHFTYLEPLLIVIYAVPFFFAVSKPLLFTATTFLLFEEYVILSELYDGESFGFKVYFLPIFIVMFFFTP